MSGAAAGSGARGGGAGREENASRGSGVKEISTQEGSSSSPTAAASEASSAVDFLMLVQSLKNLPRTGWVRKGVTAPESISDHMHRMSLMAFVMSGSEGIDRDRCIKMALIHDVAEALVGDITPSCGVGAEEKQRREREAMGTLGEALGPLGLARAELLSLWEEYEAGETDEAKLVKDFDKLEMILQALEYEKAQDIQLQEFFDSTKGRWKTAIGRCMADNIVARREEMQRSRQAAAAAATPDSSDMPDLS